MDSDDSDQFQNSPKVPQKTEEKSALKAKNMEKMDSDDSEYWLIQEVVENLKIWRGHSVLHFIWAIQ